MTLIRPDAAAGLKRWAEPLAALALIGWGLWWGVTSFGVIRWLGFVLITVGGALLVLGIRRARFWRGAGGLGHVEVDEGSITYFAPEGGGTLAIDALTGIALVQRGHGPRAWELTAPAVPPVWIPLDASGAQALFDVFANLPGLEMQALLRHLNTAQQGDVVIWHRNDTRLH